MFDPDREVKQAEEYLRKLAKHPGWAEYAADRARRMAAEDHGLWRPLKQLADELDPPKGGRHAGHRM